MRFANSAEVTGGFVCQRLGALMISIWRVLGGFLSGSLELLEGSWASLGVLGPMQGTLEKTYVPAFSGGSFGRLGESLGAPGRSLESLEGPMRTPLRS